jgi:subtilisin family serine protease
MRSFVIAILALAVAWSASGTAAAAVTDPDGLIVRFEPGVSAAERAAIRDEAGTDLERTFPVPGMQLLDLEPGQGRAAAERALERRDGVLYAEPNAVRRASLRPDDLHYPLLWGLENTGQAIRGTAGSIDADTDAGDAWDAGIGGGGAVAVIDSGVDLAHPDLAANAWRNPGESGAGRESNGLDDDLNGRVDDWRGWDFVAGDSDPADENGHGTHVAGTIAALRGNGIGVAGVADGSRLMALRVLNAQGTGSVAGVIQAYGYAARAGAKVVNLSLGSSTSSRAESDAIAAHPEMLFVAAAGNGGDDGIGDDTDLFPEYPCAYPLSNVVCVAASDNRDRLATFSNYGDLSVDLAAPGVDIVSTLPGDRYGWASGTSMATPHVSGAAALLWAASPGASAAQIKSALTVGADPVAAFAGRTVSGGRLNVLSSLRLVADVTLVPPAPAPSPAPWPDTDDPGDSGGGDSGGGDSDGGDSDGDGSEGEDSDGEDSDAAEPSPRPDKTLIGDTAPPRLSVRVARHQRIGRMLRRGLPVRVRCSEGCVARVRLTAGRGMSGSVRGRAIRAGSAKRFVVRLGRAGHARVRASAARRAKLVVIARDRHGNRRTVTLGILLRR